MSKGKHKTSGQFSYITQFTENKTINKRLIEEDMGTKTAELIEEYEIFWAVLGTEGGEREGRKGGGEALRNLLTLSQ